MRFRHNMHIHTFRSNCGQPEMVIADIVERAESAGLEVIGLVDHVDLGAAKEIAALHADRRDVERLRPALKVLVGTEVTMLSPRRLAITPEQAQGLDFVMVAANHFHLREIVEQPTSDSPQAFAEHALAMLQGAIETGMADIIAHPLVAKTGVLAFEPERLITELTSERLAPVLIKAAQRGTAMELNPWLAAQFPAFYAVFIAACKEHGVRFALGSDAHRLENIPYAGSGVHRGAGPDDLEALGVRGGDLVEPLTAFSRQRR